MTLVTASSAGMLQGARRSVRDGRVNAAGVLLRAPGGRVLLVKRSPSEANFGGHWALPGGGVETGESHEEAARRETHEEVGYDLEEPMALYHVSDNGYRTFQADVSEEFTPRLNAEHTAYAWADPSKPPRPLHPGVQAMLDVRESRRQASDALPFALDRASVRATDEDGHLHVRVTPISKAVVNPYMGKEIPYYQELGLDPNKIYKLLRHPDELRKAARSFSGKPLLIVHKPLNALEHPYQKVIGSVGTEPTFDGTYLKAPLTVWTNAAIKLIESGRQKELSSGYRYRADMTPGVFKGQKYDGVMRDIRGNHVAIVTEGRAGPDVVVGDSKENLNMAKSLLTRKAAAVQGALTVFLAPLLAEDQKVDLTKGLRGITNKNYAAKIPLLERYVAQSVKGKLMSGVAMAADATPEGLRVLLEALSDCEPGEASGMEEQGEFPDGPPEQDDAEPEEMGGEPMPEVGEGGEPDDGGEGGESGLEGVKAFLKGQLSPEAFQKLEQMLQALAGGGGGGEQEAEPVEEEGGEPDLQQEEENTDEAPLDESEPTEREDQQGEDEPPAFPGRPRIPGKDKMRKGAMDENTVNGIVKAAVQAERAVQKNLREALDDAKPYVGAIVGCDSAEKVYVKALTIKGVKPDALRGAPVGVMRELLHQFPTKARREPLPAMDSAAGKSYNDRYPEAARIGRV